MNNLSKIYKYLFFLILLPIITYSHDGQEERLKFWKDYYNPKLEVVQQDVPEIEIILNKIGPFFQLETNVKNFTLTPDQDLKNNNTWTGYGKLFINGVYTTRIYSRYLFLKEMPIGENEFKVILSSNMDTDIAYNDKVISDSIIIQFPEYNFAEARSRAYGLSIQCEFSDEGKINRDKLSKKGMKVSESSKYLQCRQDSQKLLKEFKKQMSKLQLIHYEVTMASRLESIEVWKNFERKRISLSQARKKILEIDNNIDSKIRDRLELVHKR